MLAVTLGGGHAARRVGVGALVRAPARGRGAAGGAALEDHGRRLRADRARMRVRAGGDREKRDRERRAVHALSAAFSYTMRGVSFFMIDSSLMTISRMFLCEGTSYMML